MQLIQPKVQNSTIVTLPLREANLIGAFLVVLSQRFPTSSGGITSISTACCAIADRTEPVSASARQNTAAPTRTAKRTVFIIFLFSTAGRWQELPADKETFIDNFSISSQSDIPDHPCTRDSCAANIIQETESAIQTIPPLCTYAALVVSPERKVHGTGCSAVRILSSCGSRITSLSTHYGVDKFSGIIKSLYSNDF